MDSTRNIAIISEMERIANRINRDEIPLGDPADAFSFLCGSDWYEWVVKVLDSAKASGVLSEDDFYVVRHRAWQAHQEAMAEHDLADHALTIQGWYLWEPKQG